MRIQIFCTKLRRGRVALPALNVAFYGIMRNLIEFVLLLCFQNLLAYGFALFSKFALLRSQIWKRRGFALFVRISAMQVKRFTKIVVFVTSLGLTFLGCIAFFCICFFCFSSFYFALFVRMRLGSFAPAGATRALPHIH